MKKLTYVLEKGIRIGRWKDGLSLCFFEGKQRPVRFDPEEYEVLKLCDGTAEIEETPLLDRLELMRIIRRCENDKKHHESGSIREYSNYYVRTIDWTLTDRCNYSCLHCFHAMDNTMHRDEFSLEEAMRFLDEMQDCGIPAVRLTGGEPTLYPYFREVIEGIRARGMSLMTLITNGSLLTPELLSFIKELHPNAHLMISFDGIGWHDWLRQYKGSEEKTLAAVRLCREAGFAVDININVHRKNIDVIFDSVKMLEELGVQSVRIIRTTEAPRWQLNQENNTLTPEEYYDFSCRFAEKYCKSGILIPVTIWQSLYIRGKTQSYSILAMKTSEDRFSDQARICSAMAKKPSVQANGEFLPCAPLGGYAAVHGMHFGNVLKTGLKELLSEGAFIETIHATVREKFEKNPKCASCAYAKVCQGGCPALSLISGGSLFSSDAYKCVYFEKGYYERYCDVLAGWKDLKKQPQ